MEERISLQLKLILANQENFENNLKRELEIIKNSLNELKIENKKLREKLNSNSLGYKPNIERESETFSGIFGNDKSNSWKNDNPKSEKNSNSWNIDNSNSGKINNLNSGKDDNSNSWKNDDPWKNAWGDDNSSFCETPVNLKPAPKPSIPKRPEILTNYKFLCVHLHNDYRRKHFAPDLVICDNLNKIAQNYAETLAEKNIFEHSTRREFGENLFASHNYGTDATENVKMAVKGWYDEISLYDWNNPGFSLEAGHFTQVIWKETAKLGVGIASNSYGNTYVVVNYSPPGNYEGQFRSNVLRENKTPGSCIKIENKEKKDNLKTRFDKFEKAVVKQFS